MSDSAVPVISMRHTSAWPLALVYAAALFGGFVADRIIGYQR